MSNKPHSTTKEIYVCNLQDQSYIYFLLRVCVEWMHSILTQTMALSLMLHTINRKKKRKHLNRRKLIMSMTDYYYDTIIGAHHATLSITYIHIIIWSPSIGRLNLLLHLVFACFLHLLFVTTVTAHVRLISWYFFLIETCPILWRIDLFCLFFYIMLYNFLYTCVYGRYVNRLQRNSGQKSIWLNDVLVNATNHLVSVVNKVNLLLHSTN